MPNKPTIEGLPEGATLKPIAGLPEGAELRPVSTAAPINPVVPQGALLVAPQSSWIEDAEHDLRQGGNRTVLGRIGGYLQGRGDKGFEGIESGTSKGTANYVGSPVLGTIQAAKGIDESAHGEGWKGLKDTVGGVLSAASLPLAFAGGPEASAAIEAIPSRAHAAEMLESVMNDAKDIPVSLTRSLEPLERTQQLAARGAPPAGVADKLYQRANQITPITYGEGRDFASNISNLSTQDKLALNKPMQATVNQLKTAFHSDLAAAADTVGRGQDYLDAVKEYAQNAQMREALAKSAKLALRTGAGALGLGAIYEGAHHLKELFK